MPPGTGSADSPGGGDQTFRAGEDVAGDWWTLFHAPALSQLVAEALRRNPSLEAAQQTLHQAQETTLAQEGGFLPTLQGQAFHTRQEFSGASVGVPGLAQTFSLYDTQLNVSYTFDVWGQNRRSVEADVGREEYQRFLLLGAVNMLASNVATAAITAASLDAQVAAEQQLVDAERGLLTTVQSQFRLGGATGTDVATQAAQLAQTEALLVPLQTQAVQQRDLLAADLGQAPSEAELPKLSLEDLTLPGDLPVSVAGALLAQRPDIRAAEAQLRTASAQIGVAIANRLPQLTLTGNIGTEPISTAQLFSPGNGIFTVTEQLLAPIFQGGQLLHQQRAAVAAAKAAAASYRNTVVGAYQNVADVLTALEQDAKGLAANAAAAKAASRSLELARLQYKVGGVAYLTVLTSETTYQNAVINLIRARAARYTDTVALFTALGGGWWNRQDVAKPPAGLLKSLLP